MKYLFIKCGNLDGVTNGGYVKIVDKPEVLLQSDEYDSTTDSIYQIGSEVKVKISFEPVPAMRGRSYEAEA